MISSTNKNISFCIVENFVKGMVFSGLEGLFFDHVLNIMLCFLCLFVLMYDIGIKFDMIYIYIYIVEYFALFFIQTFP